MPNLFSPLYFNLEKEVLSLADSIYFDDSQLNVYSIKIAELLIRTVIEIETLSKELYFKNGGTNKYKSDGSLDFLYFDTDCIDFLEKNWNLSKKEVIVSAPNFYFHKTENQILTPLHKANKRGSSSSDWAKAYQAVKHDRSKNLYKATIKHLIRALAALYLLNVYNKTDDEVNSETKNNDLSFGSKIYTVKKSYVSFSFPDGTQDDIDDSFVCIEKYPDSVFKDMIIQSREDYKSQIDTLINSREYKDFMEKNPNYNFNEKNLLGICYDVGGSDFLSKILHISNKAFCFLSKDTMIILNKNQQVYPKV